MLLALAALGEPTVGARPRLLGPFLLPVAPVLLLLADLVEQGGGALGRHVQFQFLLEVVQLLHEIEVGGDVGLPLADQVEGVVQVQREPVHEVGDRYGHGTGDAGQTVDEDAFLAGPSFFCNTQEGWVVE